MLPSVVAAGMGLLSCPLSRFFPAFFWVITTSCSHLQELSCLVALLSLFQKRSSILNFNYFFFLLSFFLIRYTFFFKGYCKNSSVFSNKVSKCWQICCTPWWCMMFPAKWRFATSEWGQTSYHRWCTLGAWNSRRLQPNKPKEKTLQAECDWFEVLYSFLLVMAHHNHYLLISQEKKTAFDSGSVSSVKLCPGVDTSMYVFIASCLFSMCLM